MQFAIKCFEKRTVWVLPYRLHRFTDFPPLTVLQCYINSMSISRKIKNLYDFKKSWESKNLFVFFLKSQQTAVWHVNADKQIAKTKCSLTEKLKRLNKGRVCKNWKSHGPFSFGVVWNPKKNRTSYKACNEASDGQTCFFCLKQSPRLLYN